MGLRPKGGGAQCKNANSAFGITPQPLVVLETLPRIPVKQSKGTQEQAVRAFKQTTKKVDHQIGMDIIPRWWNPQKVESKLHFPHPLINSAGCTKLPPG